MTAGEASEFLQNVNSLNAGQWADLGCGTGIFTQALATMLAPGSYIHAVDRHNSFNPYDSMSPVSINFIKADFVHDEIRLPLLNGILMANSLHYIRDKTAFIQKWQNKMADNGCWVIIEYDTEKENQWVPYPVSFAGLKNLFHLFGYREIHKAAERQSVYNSGKMYCATIRR